jgi:hypothetical protein
MNQRQASRVVGEKPTTVEELRTLAQHLLAVRVFDVLGVFTQKTLNTLLGCESNS